MLPKIDWEARFAAMRREREIRCPHCDYLLTDEEYRHVTPWGEDPPKEEECIRCEKTYFVTERVHRTYTTSKEGPRRG